MTSIYTISREDLYDYRRCPKIVAIKAYRALRAVREPRLSQPRELEPATIGMIGEAAVKLGFQGLPRTEAMKQITLRIPQVKINDHLQEIAIESLRGVEEVRRKLAKEYGIVNIIGRGEGRHPDLAGKVRPDFIALADGNANPVIVETKDTTRTSPSDNFQAMLYNGIAERYGLYLVEERLEGKRRVFSPRLIQKSAEALLVYPRLARYYRVKEKFVPDESMIKGIWKAKELGFKGLTPETECGKKCVHNRLKVRLPEGDMEPLPPPPLIFSEGIRECGYSFDLDYQTRYAWNLLPQKTKLAILFSSSKPVGGLVELRDWLTEAVGLDEEAADIVLNYKKREAFLGTRPDAQYLVKSMESELEAWKTILKERLVVSGSSILAVATAVYSLPSRSSMFVKDAWDRWH